MRNVRTALNWMRTRAQTGDASTRAAIALGFGLVLLVGAYVAWEAVTRHG